MEREFITYEQALALKELGFDKQSLLRLPLKSQVFRWFRENYGLHSLIDITIEDEWFFQIFNLNAKRNPEILVKDKSYKAYEEAENACIDKLIEIAKQQENDEK